MKLYSPNKWQQNRMSGEHKTQKVQ